MCACCLYYMCWGLEVAAMHSAITYPCHSQTHVIQTSSLAVTPVSDAMMHSCVFKPSTPDTCNWELRHVSDGTTCSCAPKPIKHSVNNDK